MQSNTRKALIIFIKNPEKGKVKTRLAQTVGAEKALAIYKALLGHTRRIAEVLPCQRYLFYDQYINKKDDWSNRKFHKLLQASGDLGKRMATAFQTVFEKNQSVVIIGSDCASLNPGIIEEAFEKLASFPYVIGPAMDGGYYLLGMQRFTPELFQNMPWSTADVFPTTIERIEALDATYHLLPKLSDIDYEEDWEKFGWDLDQAPKKPNTKYSKVVIPPQTNA
jgi:rSAM/selenodomain-associated transferase 1